MHAGGRGLGSVGPARASVLAWAVTVLGAFATAGPALADPSPAPVDPGQFYASAGISVLRFETSDFAIVRQYVNDSALHSGEVSTETPMGFLVGFSTDEKENVYQPEVQLGYAFEKAPFGGMLGTARIHLKVYGSQREGNGTIASAQVPLTGFTVTDSDGIVYPTGLTARWGGIDGVTELPPDLDTVFFHSFRLNDINMFFENTIGWGDLMVYFDEPVSSFQLTRGVGLSLGYEESDWKWYLRSDDLGVADPIFAGKTWNYVFDMSTFYFGPRAAFSLGWEPIRWVNLFLDGSAAALLAVTDIQGEQLAPCLSACDVMSTPRVSVDGRRYLSRTDLGFAYEAKIGAGASIYLKYLRLTANVGVLYNNFFTMPREQSGDDAQYDAHLASQWAYYGRVIATLAF